MTDGVQLALRVGLRDGPSFSNFIAGPNEEAVRAVRKLVANEGERVAYLWGARGTGKTHVLEASCREASSRHHEVAYLPLGRKAELMADACEGLDQLNLVCIDDADAIAGDRIWEEAVFYLYERAERSGTRLLFAAGSVPRSAGFRLPDLTSRLGRGLTLRLRPLDDEAKTLALQCRARNRGFALPDEVISFLLRRYPRDTHSLFELLERVDDLTLSEKRVVTIPFVKRLLAD
ncbi:MAG: DnaA regulatory inactivator Hda [Gammaproteobacteria bacterium]